MKGLETTGYESSYALRAKGVGSNVKECEGLSPDRGQMLASENYIVLFAEVARERDFIRHSS